MPQTEAQRRASEENLRKGNPKAFSKSPDADRLAAEAATRRRAEPAPSAPAGKRTFRASADPAPAKPRKKTRAAPAPASEPAPAKQGGGFYSGLIDGLRG